MAHQPSETPKLPLKLLETKSRTSKMEKYLYANTSSETTIFQSSKF